MAGIPETQKAWFYEKYGTTEVMKLGEQPVPSVQDDLLLIKVKAAALNPADWKRRAGLVPANDPLPAILGCDAAGVVVAKGPNASAKFSVGDEVYVDVHEHAIKAKEGPLGGFLGTLAQYTVAPERLVAHKPKALSFEEAASLPLAVETAMDGFDQLGLKEGQSVLILGGSGGVGTLAVQLAKKLYKAGRVVATTSSRNAALVTSLGADEVIDYTKEKFWEREEKFDVVYDTVGQLLDAVKAIKPGGTCAGIGGPYEGLQPPAFSYVLVSSGAKLERVNPLLEAGEVKAVLDSKGPFSFNDAVNAFAHLESGRANGKVVVSPVP